MNKLGYGLSDGQHNIRVYIIRTVPCNVYGKGIITAIYVNGHFCVTICFENSNCYVDMRCSCNEKSFRPRQLTVSEPHTAYDRPPREKLKSQHKLSRRRERRTATVMF